MFPLFLEREFPPSTLTKPRLESEVGREGLELTTAVTSLDRHSPFRSPGSRPRGPEPKDSRGCGGRCSSLALSPPSCAVLGTGQAFVKSSGEPDPLSGGRPVEAMLEGEGGCSQKQGELWTSHSCTLWIAAQT